VAFSSQQSSINDDPLAGLQLDEKLLLATLNRERDFKAEFSILESTFPEDPDIKKAIAEYSASLTSRLTQHVGDWVGSGYQSGGTGEEPFTRRISSAVQSDIVGWINHDIGEFTRVSETGEADYGLLRHSFNAGLVNYEPDEQAALHARQMLFWLLSDSRLKYAIARCHACKHFYVRAKPRRFYKRETFCPGCRKKCSTDRRMKKVRSRKKEAMINRAARARKRWATLADKTRAQYRSEKTYIFKAVARFRVTPKWVSRNWQTIANHVQHLESSDECSCFTRES
jgi:hypothetical protein